MMAYINPEPTIDDLIEINRSSRSKRMLEEKEDYIPINEVYFAFIDVLGFKKAFDDSLKSKKTQPADNFRDVFNYYFELMNASKFMKNGNSQNCYAGQTSDSLYFYTERADFLVEFMKIYSHFSLYAMTKKVFFRGGIAKGNLYKKEQYQFFGNSVIYAYLLESVVSKYPIIVIDEKTNWDLMQYSEYVKMVNTKNGRIYIKPFVFLHNPVDLDTYDFSKREIDSKLVEKNIKELKEQFDYYSPNFEKYVFLLEELKQEM